MKANVAEIKARLSEFLARIERGESVIICRRNRPIAELRPLARARVEPRPIGGAKGQLLVPDTFFDPLPADMIASFEGSMAYDDVPHAALSIARETAASPVPHPQAPRTPARKASRSPRRR